MEKIIIFDTTLRDGEQSPGASLTKDEKLEIAHQLDKLGVDVIEAGFPVASEGDFEAVKLIAAKVRRPVICGLARAKKVDIDRSAAAVKAASCPRIHVFLATSKIHMRYKLKKAEDEILRQAVYFTKYARRLCGEVEFSPEDASRTEVDFLLKVVESVIDAGAAVINIPDSVGYALPNEFGSLIETIKNSVPNINKAVISVHCHDDLGLAVANSLEAVRAGAEQVECTINGIGERAGNASLEEIVMALDVRKEAFNKATSIGRMQIYKTSRLVSKLTGINVQPNKAIVGENAFAHESGVHQDGILKKRTTYEIIDPQDIGIGGTRLVLGKHSGSHAFSERLKELGYKLSEQDKRRAFAAFKELADKKKRVFDSDIEAIIEDEITKQEEVWKFAYLHISCATDTPPSAFVKLKYRGKIKEAESSGDGPVDACYKAIDKITGLKGELKDYSIRAVSSGKDALGEVSVKIKSGAYVTSGRAASTDIIEASAKAYLAAMNKIASGKTRSIRGLKESL